MPASLTHGEVAEAAAAWLWYPTDAAVVRTDRYLLVRFPDHFGDPVQVRAGFATYGEERSYRLPL